MKDLIQWEAVKWPDDMAPSRCPIHFTNERQVAASSKTIWSLLTDPYAWPHFYPGVEQAPSLQGSNSLSLGVRFETKLAGQQVLASVQEFEPLTRIAWYGGPIDSEESKAYHAWIITPTPSGCHLRTEETMRGPLWIELAKKAPDAFWLTHEKLLASLANIAEERTNHRNEEETDK
ncbi:SRPBCC domain-containing protein [Granulicella tundricola]|uniref:Polyketide cyclase/dehydrase n=1 Tax=Granulicella tundricola (strain ATCC BAA-1859 / DSM 23138 / MP5ACTX9) TaxID=1198114 RepID=E8WWB8_GRATM|nr:SRPBCC domain-containing protein [Granulicella tundricola]ADW68501.1 Polyketide cyclase/dehydrase [Granulicella tundricola MP5ACTX9]